MAACVSLSGLIRTCQKQTRDIRCRLVSRFDPGVNNTGDSMPATRSKMEPPVGPPHEPPSASDWRTVYRVYQESVGPTMRYLRSPKDRTIRTVHHSDGTTSLLWTPKTGGSITKRLRYRWSTHTHLASNVTGIRLRPSTEAMEFTFRTTTRDADRVMQMSCTDKVAAILAKPGKNRFKRAVVVIHEWLKGALACVGIDQERIILPYTTGIDMQVLTQEEFDAAVADQAA